MGRKNRGGRPSGHVPRYRVLAEDLTKRIAAGEWAAGTSVPSCRQLAAEYDVGFSVAQRALKALEADGRIRISPHPQDVAHFSASLDSIRKGGVALVCRGTMAGALGSPVQETERLAPQFDKWPSVRTGPFISMSVADFA